MKLRIEDIRFGQNKITVRVSFWHSIGEPGYEDCWHEVVDLEGVPTGEMRFSPFTTVPIECSLTTTKLEARDKILKVFNGFKASQERIAQIQDWIGFEYED